VSPEESEPPDELDEPPEEDEVEDEEDDPPPVSQAMPSPSRSSRRE
jgi:hypothetical protein